MYRNSSWLKTLLFAYRLNADAGTWMFAVDVDVDAHVTTQRNQRHEREIMFEPAEFTGLQRWPVVQLRVGCKTEVTLLGGQFFSVGSHWVTQTVLCCGDECALCELLPIRALYYLPVQWNGRVSLLELSTLAAANFEQHCKLFGEGMIPGVVLEISRRSQKSPMYSECVRTVPVKTSIDYFNLATHVMILYKFPCPNPTEELDAYEVRISNMARLRNKRLRDQMTVYARQ